MSIKILYTPPKTEDPKDTQNPEEQEPQLSEEDLAVFKQITESINDRVLNNEIAPISGRVSEIAELEEVLSRKTKHNPLLIGDPGVGKTAIVEGFVQRIINKEVGPEFADVEVHELKFNNLMSGAGIVGALNEKVQQLVRVLKNKPNYILFIDEIHMIINAGTTNGSTQGGLGDQLKTELARGQIRVIGATTNEEYRKYILPEGAFDRRFSRISVKQPNRFQSISMMHNMEDYLVNLYGSKIDESAVIAAYDLAKRYYPQKNMPDACISLLESACAFHKTFPTKMSKEELVLIEEIKSLEKQLQASSISIDPVINSETNLQSLQENLSKLKVKLQEEQERVKKEKSKFNLDKNPDYIELQKLKKDYDQWCEMGELVIASEILYTKIMPLQNKFAQSNKIMGYTPSLVTKFDVEHALASDLNKPLEDITASFIDKAKRLPERLKKRVFGQDEAIDTISRAILRRAVGWSDDTKPIGVFLLLGNTGVGKTETAKALAKELYGSEESGLIRINMGENQELWKLTGADPGFKNSEQGSMLVNELEAKQSAVVLFDEFDKINDAQVATFFLNLLDEGYFVSGMNKKMMFNNCIILLSANDMTKLNDNYPELLARTNPVVFNDFNELMINLVIDKNLNNIIKMAKSKGYIIAFNSDVKDFLKKDFNVKPDGRQITFRCENFVKDRVIAIVPDLDPHKVNVINAKMLRLDEVTLDELNANTKYIKYKQDKGLYKKQNQAFNEEVNNNNIYDKNEESNKSRSFLDSLKIRPRSK